PSLWLIQASVPCLVSLDCIAVLPWRRMCSTSVILASVNPAPNALCCDTKVLGCFIDCLEYKALDMPNVRRLCVAGLLFAGCPSAIPWRVTFSVVYSIKRRVFRPLPHVFQKVFESKPSISHSNSGSAISVEVFTVWI